MKLVEIKSQNVFCWGWNEIGSLVFKNTLKYECKPLTKVWPSKRPLKNFLQWPIYIINSDDQIELNLNPTWYAFFIFNVQENTVRKNRQQLFTTYAVNKTKHIKGVKGNRGANEGETGD